MKDTDSTLTYLCILRATYRHLLTPAWLDIMRVYGHKEHEHLRYLRNTGAIVLAHN